MLVGNRDEFHARESAPLSAWPNGRVLAGRDLQAGGTWIGAGANGRCSVVTNVRHPQAAESTARSRGELPIFFLDGTCDAAACSQALVPQAGEFAPFNLLMIDGTGCQYIGNHPGIEARAVPDGVHGMSNGGFDVAWPKTGRLCAAVSDWLLGDADDPRSLWSALRDERTFPDEDLPDTGIGLTLERRLSPVFIVGPTYGTRASTVIAIDHDGRGWIGERRYGPDGVFIGETILPLTVIAGR